ncbi:uncharacterized protein LOC130416122 [Triplophysa dalaica]|uniref:uncharacterized protein LOC130416122 n=1 Tax=Triplophysa dalaica TaxID=1582913 RepID=UPI0024DF7CE2|nr:uncharacterized protein LOC130416122 [Triplophysa dalaica]
MSLILILGTLGLLAQGSYQEVQSPEFLSVKESEFVSISCTGTSGVDDDMSWYLHKTGEAPKLLIYKANNLETGISDRFSGSQSGLLFTLTIREAKPEDAGDYYCMGVYSDGRCTVKFCHTKTSLSQKAKREAHHHISMLRQITCLSCDTIHLKFCVLGQVVMNQPEVKSAQIGQSVSIDCKVNTVVYRVPTGSTSKDYYISWYLQRAEGPPKLLIYYTTMKPSDSPSRMSGGGSFHSGGNGLDFSLTNSNVHLEDAGVYYCMSVHRISDKWVFTQ